MKKIKNIAVVIPSYNEVQNIPILIKGINKELLGAKIVVVDDSFKSENAKLKIFLNKYRNVKLISRLKKSGRGSAVLEGFRETLKDGNVKYIFEMDSDLAHDPKEFMRFLNEVEVFPYDLVIGSRYKPGGKIKNISKDRTILSRLINKFLYFWLGMHLSDHTSGFRLYSRRSVEYLLKSDIKSKGFITLSETAYKLFLAEFSIIEVPITWNYRIYGKSNVNLKELLISLFYVIKMRTG